MNIGDVFPYNPRPNFYPGLHCKACDAPLSDVDDPELCMTCLETVYDLNRKFYKEIDDESDLDEMLGGEDAGE